jgi:hypothetical protein
VGNPAANVGFRLRADLSQVLRAVVVLLNCNSLQVSGRAPLPIESLGFLV